MSEVVGEPVLLGQAGISKRDIWLQVSKIRSSRAFENQKVLKKILDFLVAEALAGRVPSPPDIAEECKKEDFDEGDASVRRNMGRLREKLAEYYRVEATPNEFWLDIPDRQYYVLAPRADKKSHLRVHPNGAIAGITEPEDGEEVFYRVTARGRIEKLDWNLRVWLVVGTPCRDLYPQCQVSRTAPEWEHEVGIGLVQWGRDEGAEYMIYLVAVRADGDAAFYQYVKSGKDGFGPLLPTDGVVLDSKRVTRRDIRPGAESPPQR